MGDSRIDLVQRLACLVRASHGALRDAAQQGALQPVHLAALRYLRVANRYSNTPAALAEYLGTTKGTVSQSLLLLYRRGLVERHADERDGRIVRLALSPAGEAALAGDPELEWLACAATIDEASAGVAARVLSELLGEWQRRRGGRSFGVCASCGHFERPGGRQRRCGLTGEPLSAADATMICREHRVIVLTASGPDTAASGAPPRKGR